MGHRPKLDIKFIIGAVFLIGFILKSVGPDLRVLISAFIFLDLLIAFVAIVRGARAGKPGMMAGGCICALVALSSTQYLDNPTYGAFFLQLAGGAVGVGSYVIFGTSSHLD